MSSPFDQFTNNEVTELPEDVTRKLRFSSQVDSYSSTITGRDGAPVQVTGLTLHVLEEDGKKVNKPLNVISRRLLQALAPYHKAGTLDKILFSITARGAPPKTDYEVLAQVSTSS